MAAKGYSTKAAVATFLAKTLTAAQDTYIDDTLMEAAERFIDRYTNNAWLPAATPTVTAEKHTLPIDGKVRLDHIPAIAVSAVTARLLSVGAVATVLVSNTQYELIDAANGVLLIGGVSDIINGAPFPESYYEYQIAVTYTYTAAIPKDVTLAATMIVAYWLQPSINPDSYGVKRYSVGQELSVEFNDKFVTDKGVPVDAIALLDNLKLRGARFVFA